ncbi:hypothetical protein Q7P37_001589 [Cladosporium fusiforme]
MLVPRSFKYSSSHTSPVIEPQASPRNSPRSKPTATPHSQTPSRPSKQPHTHAQTSSDTMRPPSQPVDVPLPERTRASASKTVGHAQGKAYGAGRRKRNMPDQHKAEALSPSVAALLAMTTIPRRPRQNRTRLSDKRQISIDELINEWKSDDRLGKSYDSSPLSILLDNADDCVESRTPSYQSSQYSRPQYERSTSSESIPSLEADESSLLSFGSPATPDSIHSRKSSMAGRKDSPRSKPIRESCIEDHPLKPAPEVDEDDFTFRPDHSPTAPKSKSFFKSNLTTSLQALKLAALSPFGQRKNTPAPNTRVRRTSNKPERGGSVSPLPDDVLWSHPFLFPRFSPEVRPDYKGTPTSAQRRYLNPTPLSFEEQEAPFQQALHAPYLAEQQFRDTTDGPTIQLQTYSRSGSRGSKSKSASKSAAADVDADDMVVNAALAAAMRQREPRENSDFLRVVVLEMNMRREGKLEMGRAKIWLPPRQSAEGDAVVQGKVPRRWIGVSAE